MTSVSAAPKVNTSIKFRRAALAVQCSVKVNNIIRRIETPPVLQAKKPVSTKPKTSVQFRRAALAIQYSIKANNRTMHQSRYNSMSQQETQNIIEVEDPSVELTPHENASASTVASIQTVEESTAFQAPAPARRSCLKSTESSSSTKAQKSVTMNKHARIRKTPPRSCYTPEMIESVWYSRAELQTMHDKVAKKMNRNGVVAVQSFWPLEGVFVPPSLVAQVVAEQVARDQERSSRSTKKQRKVTFAPDTKKGVDIKFLPKQKLPDFGSDMFPMLNVVQHLQVSNRAA
jgi:hypothetical protein